MFIHHTEITAALYLQKATWEAGMTRSPMKRIDFKGQELQHLQVYDPTSSPLIMFPLHQHKRTTKHFKCYIKRPRL